MEIAAALLRNFEELYKMRNKIFTIRTLLFAVAMAFCVFLLNGCYILKQGTCFLKYSIKAVPVKKIQNSPETPEDLRRFLSLVNEIRDFAADSAGLNKNSNFTRYIDINKNHIVDVVYGAGRTDFSPYTWHFPFIGSFPNKGFFDLTDAQKEAGRLGGKGYDTYLARADAFSTLGFFSDPIYSFMKNFSIFRIARLIIHEQTHATLFIKNQLQFNEELAMFAGNEGGLRFVKAKYGDTSKVYRQAIIELHDEDAYYKLIRILYTQLKKVYDDSAITTDEKLRNKQRIIARFQDSVAQNYNSIFQSPDYAGLSKININNAFITADMTYTLNLDMFYALYDKNQRDLRQTIACLKKTKFKSKDPHSTLKRLLES